MRRGFVCRGEIEIVLFEGCEGGCSDGGGVVRRGVLRSSEQGGKSEIF